MKKFIPAALLLFFIALLAGAFYCPWLKSEPALVQPGGQVIEQTAKGAAHPDQPEQVGDAAAYFGYVPDARGTRKFLDSLNRPLLIQQNPDLTQGLDDKQPVLLYRALYEAYSSTHDGKKWIVGAQGIGDCVSWGWAHGCDVHLAVMWKLGDTGEWRAAATESIYGGSRVESRCGDDTKCSGGWGDGSYGGAAAKWVRDWGVCFRQPYPDFALDLTTYSSSRAKSWGNYGSGGQGDKGKFDTEAKKHPVRNVALVRNFQEAAAAISSGYPIPVCSGRGFSSRRDKDGFCAPSGSWAHCMCFTSVRFDRPGLLCQNSWGPNWVGGPKWPDDQPEGSFWVDADVATAMLRGGDSFAVSGYEGFPYRNLKNGEWVMTEPFERLSREQSLVSHLLKAEETSYALAP